MIPCNVTLKSDDVLLALESMRQGIAADDRFLASYPNSPAMQRGREDRWQAYQRIAKSLGLKPTLSSRADEATK